jgi:ferredoxin
MTKSTPGRLVLDASRCNGHGLCALLCSERISLDEWGYAAVDRSPFHSRGTLRRARRAAAACPAAALAVEVEVERVDRRSASQLTP